MSALRTLRNGRFQALYCRQFRKVRKVRKVLTYKGYSEGRESK